MATLTYSVNGSYDLDPTMWVRRNKQISQEGKDSLLKAESMREDAPIPGHTHASSPLGPPIFNPSLQSPSHTVSQTNC